MNRDRDRDRDRNRNRNRDRDRDTNRNRARCPTACTLYVEPVPLPCFTVETHGKGCLFYRAFPAVILIFFFFNVQKRESLAKLNI